MNWNKHKNTLAVSYTHLDVYKRQIKINGENFKPLLADAVSKLDDVTVINQLNITDYLVNKMCIRDSYTGNAGLRTDFSGGR